MPSLVSDIVSEVITNLSMVAGNSTQIYAAPRIQQHVQDACIFLIDEYWWPELMDWYSPFTDGVTGVLTSDLVSKLKNHKVSRYQDIKRVMRYDSNVSVKQLPTQMNPFTNKGTNVEYMSADATYALRPFIVWPKTALTQLAIHAKAYPVIPISNTDTVYLDRLLVAMMAAWFYATDDGTNQGQIAKFKALFDKRLTQVKSSWGNQAVLLDSRFPITENTWSERS